MLRREHQQLLNILPNKNAVTKGIIIDVNEIIASRNERKLTTEVCEQTYDNRSTLSKPVDENGIIEIRTSAHRTITCRIYNLFLLWNVRG